MTLKLQPSFLILFLLMVSLPIQAAAQFVGEINFRAYDPNVAVNPDRQLNFSSTADRIFLRTNNKYRVFAGMDADGFLVRNDKNDFVLISGDTDALKVTRDEVDTLTNLLRRATGGATGNNQQFDWDGRVELTGKTRSIHGYQTEEIKVFEEDSDNFVSVWLTEDIKINWGILQETWHQALSDVVDVDLPVEVIMNRNSFPLHIEYNRDGNIVTVVEAQQVKKGNVNNRNLDIPQGVKMIGLTDIMLRMMRGQR